MKIGAAGRSETQLCRQPRKVVCGGLRLRAAHNLNRPAAGIPEIDRERTRLALGEPILHRVGQHGRSSGRANPLHNLFERCPPLTDITGFARTQVFAESGLRITTDSGGDEMFGEVWPADTSPTGDLEYVVKRVRDAQLSKSSRNNPRSLDAAGFLLIDAVAEHAIVRIDVEPHDVDTDSIPRGREFDAGDQLNSGR